VRESRRAEHLPGLRVLPWFSGPATISYLHGSSEGRVRSAARRVSTPRTPASQLVPPGPIARDPFSPLPAPTVRRYLALYSAFNLHNSSRSPLNPVTSSVGACGGDTHLSCCCGGLGWWILVVVVVVIVRLWLRPWLQSCDGGCA
jgi:hypothetical protein